jgi:hypothetical protein
MIQSMLIKMFPLFLCKWAVDQVGRLPDDPFQHQLDVVAIQEDNRVDEKAMITRRFHGGLNEDLSTASVPLAIGILVAREARIVFAVR